RVLTSSRSECSRPLRRTYASSLPSAATPSLPNVPYSMRGFMVLNRTLWPGPSTHRLLHQLGDLLLHRRRQLLQGVPDGPHGAVVEVRGILEGQAREPGVELG